MYILVSELADLGFVRETLIFKTWNLSHLIRYKYISLQAELSNVLLFWKLWREAPKIGSPSFPIYSIEIADIDSVVYLKFSILKVWNFSLWYIDKSYFQPQRLENKLILQLGLMLIFPMWLFRGLFNISNLYGLPCVTISHYGSEKSTKEDKLCVLPSTSF